MIYIMFALRGYVIAPLLVMFFAADARAEVEIGCSHLIRQVGASFFSNAVFDVGKTIIVNAFGELSEGSHWVPAKAEIQDMNGNWHSRMGNINVRVTEGVYGSMQNWLPQNIGSTTDEFEQVFNRYPAIRCSLTN